MSGNTMTTLTFGFFTLLVTYAGILVFFYTDNQQCQRYLPKCRQTRQLQNMAGVQTLRFAADLSQPKMPCGKFFTFCQIYTVHYIFYNRGPMPANNIWKLIISERSTQWCMFWLHQISVVKNPLFYTCFSITPKSWRISAYLLHFERNGFK